MRCRNRSWKSSESSFCELCEKYVANTSNSLPLFQNADHIQRLGLRKALDTDLDKLIDPLLKLMQRHELDFHSTFRKLSFFTPSLLASNSEALATFLQELTPETLACRIPSMRQAAIGDWKKWLEAYRIRIETDKDEWASHGDMWLERRGQAMRGANPRFVLRQWVLEEVITKVDRDWQTGRRVLAKVLEVRI